MFFVKKNLFLAASVVFLVSLSACNTTVASISGSGPTGTASTCLVDRPLNLSVNTQVDCQDPAQYSCLSVDYTADDAVATSAAPQEECAAGVFDRRVCLTLKRLSDIEGDESHARDYNCFHKGIRLRGGGLRMIGQAESLEDSLRESVQRCEDLKKVSDL